MDWTKHELDCELTFGTTFDKCTLDIWQSERLKLLFSTTINAIYAPLPAYWAVDEDYMGG